MVRKMLVGFLLDGKHSGIDKYLLGFCDAAREAGVKLDFLTQEIDPELRERLASYGFGLIRAPGMKHPFRQYGAFKRVLKEGGYDAAYLNLSESFNCVLLSAAKACGVPCRIAHSHSSGVDRVNPVSRFIRRFLHKLFRPYLSRLATRRLACSSVAGEWMFSRPFEVICNAVDASRFAFDPAARERLRREMGLRDRRVFLHVGNFDYAKNQAFLLDVMENVAARGSDAVLLLVGDGGTLPALRERAEAGGSDNVRFLGLRTDVPALLSAADVFLFPSRFEGFSITCLEAQFSGVPCIFSDSIAPETRISRSVTFLSTSSPAAWAEAALGLTGERGSPALLPESASYNAVNNRKQLLSILEG